MIMFVVLALIYADYLTKKKVLYIIEIRFIFLYTFYLYIMVI